MNKVNGLLAASLLAALNGCSGGGGSSSDDDGVVIENGVFKDSNVSGLSYVSGGESGTTNSSGAFKYEAGEEVSFSLGGVNLGSGLGQAIMTPINLVADGSLDNTEVINRVRFLMMLDEDNIPSNGIDISTEVQAVAEDWADVDFAAADFPDQLDSIVLDASIEDSLAQGINITHTFPDAETATAHLRSTLLCTSAGAFQGVFSGPENGNLVFVLDPVTGEINGSSYNPDTELSTDINSTVGIDYDAGLTFVSLEADMKEYSGTVQSAENIDGTWVDSNDASITGTFDVNRLSGDSTPTYRYLASYTGIDDKGVLSFDVAANNSITGTLFSVILGEEVSVTGTLSEEGTRLDVESEDGHEITAFIDADTFAITTGTWTNSQTQISGTISSGGGCLLN